MEDCPYRSVNVPGLRGVWGEGMNEGDGEMRGGEKIRREREKDKRRDERKTRKGDKMNE